MENIRRKIGVVAATEIEFCLGGNATLEIYLWNRETGQTKRLL